MSRSILQSAIFIMLITLLGRALGLVRTIFVSQEFGTTLDASAYILALTIPNTIFVFLPGAMNAVFIPVLKGMVTQGRIKEAQNLFAKMLTITTVVYLILGIGAWIFAGQLISLIAPGASIELQILATTLLRWMIPSLLFINLIGLFSSTLNVHYYFVLPNLGTIVNSGIIILAIFLLVPPFGITGLAIGTTLGFAGAALIMLPYIVKEKYSLYPNWKWNDPELFKIGKLFIPILFGSSITSLNEFIEKFLVSGYGDDKIAALGYAYQVFQLPISIFFGAFAMPLFIVILDHIKQDKMEPARETIEKGLLYLLILLIPTTVGIWYLGHSLVAVLFQRGAFDTNSTEITSAALLFFALGLFPIAARDLITRAFYAIENTLTPVLIGILHIIMFVGLSLLIMPVMGFVGAPFSWSIASLITGTLLGVILHKKIGAFISKVSYITGSKVLCASLGMALFLYFYQMLTQDWNIYVHVALGIIVGALIYGGILIILRESFTLQLVDRAKQFIRGKIGRRGATGQ